MNSHPLADAIAAILGAFLPYIWHNNPPTTGDQQKWAAVMHLWQTLRPPLEAFPNGLDAAKNASGDPSGVHMAAFADVMAALFDQDAALKAEIEAQMGRAPLNTVAYELAGASEPRALAEAAEKLRQQIIVDARTRPTMATAVPAGIPACQECGAQDASLRVVVYPYVMSLLFLTMRRHFAGLWCERHALTRQTWASLITATLGWWGIPFGLIFAPMALWKLARGGDQPAPINQQMLTVLAQHHLKKHNDPQAAIRCLEAALEFGESQPIQSLLHRLYESYPDDAKPAPASPVLTFSGVLIGALLIGLLIGASYYALDGLLFALFAELGNLLIWIPFLAMLSLGGVMLVRLIQDAVRRVRLTDLDIGIPLAVIAGAAAAYMIPTSMILMSFIADPENYLAFETTESTISVITWLLSQGGAALLGNWAVSTEAFFIVNAVALAAICVAYIVVAGLSARAAVRSQQRIEQAQDADQRAPSMALSAGCLPIAALAVVFMALLTISMLLG